MTARWRLPWWSVLFVGVVLFSPAVRTGFLLDDYLHIAMVERTFPAPRSPVDLYNFVDDGVRPALLERGLLPWWSHPKLTLRFLRPLSSALLWVDHSVFGHRPLPMHLHSLAWWAAAAIAARALYRRALSPRVVAFATAIFALASCHAMPIAWLANREALVSLTFGTLALAAHVRWRETGRGRDAALAAVLFACALLGGGEYAISFGGYVLAMELVGNDKARSLAKRALGLAPFVVPAAAYAVVRFLLGYGAVGSGFYADPLREPLVFLQQAPWRLVALLGEAWLTIDSRAWQSTEARVALGAIVVVCLVLALVTSRRAMAKLDAPARAMTSWLLLGSLFAMLPVLAVVPAPRLLGVSMIGVAGVVAIVLDHVWFAAAAEERHGARELGQSVAIALGFAHLVHGPGASFLWSREFHSDAARFASNANRLRADVGDVTDAQIGVARGTVGMFFAPFALDPRGRAPAHWFVLADTGHVLAIRRDARTIELIAPVGSGLYPAVTGSLLRSPDARLRAGDTIVVPGVRAMIVDATAAAGPRDVVFTFDRDLDEKPAILWINETRDEWTETQLPVRGFGKPFDP